MVEVIPGADENPRVAKLKVSGKIIVRPFLRLHLLEAALTDGPQSLPENVLENTDSIQEVPKEVSNNPQNISRSGRPIKKPQKLNL